MKRLHVHVSVSDLAENVRFYSKLFGAEPTVRRTDYAKWMLEDPRVNFAISKRGHKAGLNHLGVQVDSEAELEGLRRQVEGAGIEALSESGAACCYARSDKHWVTDPQGIAWEAFHTLGGIPVFGEDAEPLKSANAACCVPLAKQSGDAADAACCVPAKAGASPAAACC